MTTVAADVRRVGESAAPRGGDADPDAFERDLRFARRLAWLLDAKFSFGRFRFGLDALIGLIPVVGDGAAALVGLYFVYLARKYRLGGWVMTGMVAVILIDFLIGSIPWLGDLFDAAYKPHLRNLRIFERAVASRKSARHRPGS